MPTEDNKARFIEPMVLQRTHFLPEGPNWAYEVKLDVKAEAPSFRRTPSPYNQIPANGGQCLNCLPQPRGPSHYDTLGG